MPGAISTPTPQTPVQFGNTSFSVDFKPDIAELDLAFASQAAIQTKLNRRLGPEYVSQRPAPGGGPKLTYVEGWKIIGLANEVFGYNGWSSSVVSITTDFVDCDPETRRHCVGVTAVVKITLKDGGAFHDDVGYGTADNVKSKGAALDKAKKEAVTDGVKRALRNFGNLLGLCLYEKAYAQEIAKIKVPPVKFDKSDLHHGPDRSTPAPATPGPPAGPPTTHTPNYNRTPAPQQDVKPLTSIPLHMRAATGNAFANGNGKGPQTPATNGQFKSNGNGATAPSGASSATGLNTPNRTPALRTSTTATPSVCPPVPQHVPHQQAPRANATSASVPPLAAPAPQNPPAPGRKVTFAQAPQGERQQSAQASSSRQPLAAMKSEPDLDRFFTASDDDAMMALDLEGLDDLDPEPSPVENRKSGLDGTSSATNGGGVNGNTGQQVPRENTSSATKLSALPSNLTGQTSVPRTSPGGFHFAHAPGNRPAVATNGQARQPPQQTSAVSSGAGMKRPAEVMQQTANNARRPMPQGGMGLAQQQNAPGNRQPLANLDVGTGGEFKRVKR